MPVERYGDRRSTGRMRPANRFSDDRLVTEMDTVEHPNAHSGRRPICRDRIEAVMRQHGLEVYRLRPVYISRPSKAKSVAANAASAAPLTQRSMGISAGTVGIPGIAMVMSRVSVAPPMRCMAVIATTVVGVSPSSGLAKKSKAAMTTAENTLGTHPADVSQSPLRNA